MTEADLEGGFSSQNMRTRGDRPMFLSGALPKLAGLAAHYNVMFLLINQVRDKPGVMFGDPTYTPGGRAIRHCCQIRARIRRIKSGRIRVGNKITGLVALIQNKKNKMGRGSVEMAECAFVVRWNRPKAAIEFMSREEAEKLMS